MVRKDHGMDEEKAAKCFRGVLLAIQDLHKLGIIHRDIKLENIMLIDRFTPDQIRLADFGLSTPIGEIGLFK